MGHHTGSVYVPFFFFLFFETGPHYVAQTGLELTDIPLPLLPECWAWWSGHTIQSRVTLKLPVNWACLPGGEVRPYLQLVCFVKDLGVPLESRAFQACGATARAAQGGSSARLSGTELLFSGAPSSNRKGCPRQGVAAGWFFLSRSSD